jgi:1-acyl-sn-glycerol-3-phosphate acyltransferase
MPILYRIAVFLARLCFTLFARWEVEGREAVPLRGPLIIVANHLSNADPPVLMASLPRRVLFMAKRGLFQNPFTAFLLRSVGAFPLSRDGRDVGALVWALRLLQRGHALVLFPEGTRSRDGCLKRGLSGVAYLALKSQAPILPVAITGTERIPGFWRIALPFCRIGVRIGSPFTLPQIEGEASRPLLEHLTDMIMYRIAQLLPEGYRGYYGTSPPGQSEGPTGK